MRMLPDGTVTLLFTDVEASTALLHELGSAYADELVEHRRSLRSVFGEHEGVEVDTQGDSFFVAFARAAAAVDAAQDAQRALRGGPIRVRMGVHTGEPDRIAEGYVGLDVVKGARIAAAAHGGQVLLSSSTRDLLDASVHVADLGLHRLKGFADLVHLFQLGSAEFPSLATAAATNLPRAAKPLVGREEDVARVRAFVLETEPRLVTIVGPGGVGKTRLAIEVAREVVADFADGTWFVDLSSIHRPDNVIPAIANAVGAKASLEEHLASSRSLLVLDNLEQVTAAASELDALLESCRGTVILGTSREPLRVSAETEYVLQPLPEGSAVELFRQRAAPRPATNSAEVAEICRRLDGLPLAIELAAARTKLLDPASLLARLDRRLPLLTSGSRDAPQRQRTLEATIGWSYDLLDGEEKRLFEWLSVFVGGFTLDAAEAVCGADFEVLASLVDKSLVRKAEGRLALLETIREFAAARLVESGEADELRRRHAAYYVRFVEELEAGLTGGDQTERLEELAQEHENLHAALDGMLDAQATDDVLRLASALAIFWYVRGFYGEGVDWLERALASPHAAQSPVYAKALWGAGMLAVLRGDPDGSGRQRLEQGVELARASGDRQTVARGLTVLGLLAFFGDDLRDACALVEQGIDAAREAGDVWSLADGLGTIGSIYPLRGEIDAGERAASEGLRIARANHDAHGIRMSLFGLALTTSRRGDARRTRELASEGLSVSRAMGDPWFTSYFLWLVSLATLRLGEPAQARAEAEEAYAVATGIGVDLLTACALEALGRAAHAQGDVDEADRYFAEGLEVSARGGVPKSYVAAIHRARAELAADRGDVERALASAEESLAIARDVGDAWEAGRASEFLQQTRKRE